MTSARQRGFEVVKPGSIGGLKPHKASEIQTWVNALIYGPPSIGKTALLGSACEVECFSPMLVLSVDEGDKTLKGMWPEVDVIQPKTFMDLQNILNQLVKEKGSGYKALGFDNATVAQKRGIEHIYNGENQATDFADFEAATWANGGWNRSTEQMRRLFDYYKMLPMHKFFTAWERDYGKPTKSNPNPNPKIAPNFSTALANEAPGYFDSVLYMKYVTVNDPKTKKPAEIRALQSQGTSTVMARDRDGGKKLPSIVQEPTMKKLAEAWGLL